MKKRISRSSYILIVAALVLILGAIGWVCFAVYDQSHRYKQEHAEIDKAMVERWFNEYLEDMKLGRQESAKAEFMVRSGIKVVNRIETWDKDFDPVLCSAELPTSLKVVQLSEEEYAYKTYRREYFIGDGSTGEVGSVGTYAVYDEVAPSITSLYCKL